MYVVLLSRLTRKYKIQTRLVHVSFPSSEQFKIEQNTIKRYPV